MKCIVSHYQERIYAYGKDMRYTLAVMIGRGIHRNKIEFCICSAKGVTIMNGRECGRAPAPAHTPESALRETSTNYEPKKAGVISPGAGGGRKRRG